MRMSDRYKICRFHIAFLKVNVLGQPFHAGTRCKPMTPRIHVSGGIALAKYNVLILLNYNKLR